MNIRSLCALIVCLGLTACIATPIEDMAPPQWQLTESFEDGEDGPPVNTQPAFLAGSWAGPQQIGGCLDSATWSTYGSTGVFERVFVNNNQCTPEQVGVYACEGTWSVLKVRGTSGVMTRSCSLDGPVSAPQITRETLTSTFSVLDGGRALNFEVWRMSEDEQRFERRETRINRYNETGPQGAQLMETSFTSTLELLDAQGECDHEPLRGTRPRHR